VELRQIHPKAKEAPPIYRTNFGNKAYVPPSTNVRPAWDVDAYCSDYLRRRSANPATNRSLAPVTVPTKSSSHHIRTALSSIDFARQESDKPFDEVSTHRSVSSSSFHRGPFDESVKPKPRQAVETYEMRQDRTSTVKSVLPGEFLERRTSDSSYSTRNEGTPQRKYDSTGQDTRSVYPRSQDAVAFTEDEEDSLFDFDDKERQRLRRTHFKASKSRAPSAKHVELDRSADADDTSPDRSCHALSPSAPLRRVQERWKGVAARQKKKCIPMKEPQHKGSPSVSFRKDDSIHHYTPDPSDTLETSTLGGRSLNSWYTKSAESEVEDVLKDIFLIGSGSSSKPGRRQVRDSPAIKRSLNTTTEEDEETLETLEASREDNPTLHMSKENENTVNRSLITEQSDDPLVSVWKFFTGEDEASERCEMVPPALGVRSIACDKPLHDTSGIHSLFDLASDLIMGGQPDSRFPKASNTSGPSTEPTKSIKSPDTRPRPNEAKPECRNVSAPSLEDDHRLVAVAIQAAKSKHKVKGGEYNLSRELSISRDIQFSVVHLEMPLGLIFQENESGCWITKVLPNGSAFRNGNVEVADQLVAIDGSSAINLKVSDVATTITSKTGSVELTFLRYTGQLSPKGKKAVTEEGYEVQSGPRPRPRLSSTLPKRAVAHVQPPSSSSVLSKKNTTGKTRFWFFKRRVAKQ